MAKIEWNGIDPSTRIIQSLGIVLELAFRVIELEVKTTSAEVIQDRCIAARHVQALLKETKQADGRKPLGQMTNQEKALIRSQLRRYFPWIGYDDKHIDGARIIESLQAFFEDLAVPESPKVKHG